MSDHDRGPGPVSPFEAPGGQAIVNLPVPPTPGALEPAGVPAEAPPQRRFPHAVRFILAVIGWVGVPFGLFLVVTDALTKDIYGSVAARDEAFATAMSIAFLASAVWVLGGMALIARLVGYRAHDAFFALIPFYTYVFQVKMLWRWTGLPDRPWDDRAVQPSIEAGAALARRRSLRPADPFIAIMCVLSIVGLVWFVGRVDDQTVEPAADEWQTVQARGMTIDVPEGYVVNTDPAAAAEMLSESGVPDAEALGELLQEFPNFFVMMAVEPSINQGRTITVFRFPSGGVPLEASARGFARGAEQSGFELVSREAATVGTGSYPAVRFDWVGGPPPPGPSIDFLIDDGPQVWTVGFVMPVGDDAHMAPIVDGVIDSVTLP